MATRMQTAQNKVKDYIAGNDFGEFKKIIRIRN